MFQLRITISIVGVYVYRPLSDKLTTWLQMALSYEPADRGGVSDHIHDEEAPCLLEMDKLLQAKVS